jgi:hypothetical protein
MYVNRNDLEFLETKGIGDTIIEMGGGIKL